MSNQLLYNLISIKLCSASAKQNAAVTTPRDACSKYTLSALVRQRPR